jgi:hypothetical protein
MPLEAVTLDAAVVSDPDFLARQSCRDNPYHPAPLKPWLGLAGKQNEARRPDITSHIACVLSRFFPFLSCLVFVASSGRHYD